MVDFGSGIKGFLNALVEFSNQAVSITDLLWGFIAFFIPLTNSPVVTNAGIAANADIFRNPIRPTLPRSMFRITACLTGTAAKLNVFVRGANFSSTTGKLQLNNSVALTTDNVFIFDISVDRTFAYNLQVDTATTITYLSVVEIPP